MARQVSLSTDELQAGLEIVRRLSTSYPVEVAFWFNYLDDNRYFLNVASAAITPNNRLEAFGIFFREVMDFGSLHIDTSMINIVDIDEPITRRALSLREGYVGISRSSSNKIFYRGTPIEEIYVYSERNLELGVLN